MKKLISISVLLFLYFTSSAQTSSLGVWAKMDAENYASFVQKEWNLSEEQEDTIYEYRLDFVAKRSHIFKQKKAGKLSEEEVKKQVQAVQTEITQKFRKYLGIHWKEYYRVEKAFKKYKNG
ncbi:hypothetical protein [Flammeovirga sp. EKP202]|uniref:hypothetical protein n=1 Tax=Flammeovirga sp. EKP202 TaxID=2770592 RepID=UPI00165F9EDD|nr:hypothetical protein [Flammeovirga sp. EKP202]MBD0401536.1 hypothetical protein [Flammeovirga sp. EKP202]